MKNFFTMNPVKINTRQLMLPPKKEAHFSYKDYQALLMTMEFIATPTGSGNKNDNQERYRLRKYMNTLRDLKRRALKEDPSNRVLHKILDNLLLGLQKI